jgi:hypothetical protein
MTLEKTVNIGSTKPYVSEFRIGANLGNTIEFKIENNLEVAIIIPNAGLFLVHPQNTNYYQKMHHGGDTIQFDVKPDAVEGIYYYHVYIIKDGEFADKIGSSAPKIVIEE